MICYAKAYMCNILLSPPTPPLLTLPFISRNGTMYFDKSTEMRVCVCVTRREEETRAANWN